MAENFPSSNHNQAAGLQGGEFGPTQWDVDMYGAFLRDLREGYDPGFNPATNAQQLGARMDNRMLGCFINSDGSVDKDDEYRIAQGRWAAGVMGMKVGETKIHSRGGTTQTPLELPDRDALPERPARKSGEFFDAAGRRINVIQADAIGAAHYIARHRRTFMEPDAFQRRFERVEREIKADGTVTVPADQVGAHIGDGLSFYRQVARVLGYTPGAYIVDEEKDAFVLRVAGNADGSAVRLAGFGETTDPGIFRGGVTASVTAIHQRQAHS